MRIEVEPRDCNIALDTEVPGRAFWVNVMEEEGETVRGFGCVNVTLANASARRSSSMGWSQRRMHCQRQRGYSRQSWTIDLNRMGRTQSLISVFENQQTRGFC